MSISPAQARELQRIVRMDPKLAPAIVGDLIAELNGLAVTPQVKTVSSDMPFFNLSAAPATKPVETNEQREQRLLDDLDAVRKAKEQAAEAAKAEEAKASRIEAIDRATALSKATTDVLQAMRAEINYNTGDVLSAETWWKFRRELAPVVAAHGFKLVNVGIKSKPKAALVEV